MLLSAAWISEAISKKSIRPVRRCPWFGVDSNFNAIGDDISIGQFSQECPVKKGRHRRYEEARQLKQTSHDDIDSLMDRIDEDPFDLPVTEEAATAFDEDDEYDD